MFVISIGGQGEMNPVIRLMDQLIKITLAWVVRSKWYGTVRYISALIVT